MAEYSQNPTVRILNEKLEETQRISNICEFEITEMIYDHQKQLLYVICGAPEFEIKIVDFSKNAKIQTHTKTNNSFKNMHAYVMLS